MSRCEFLVRGWGWSLIWCAALPAAAAPIVGVVEPTTPYDQYLRLKMTIGEATTRFELTGPAFSYFAFGFDTTTMAGYSLIVEGTDANRTAREQNLAGIGNPGVPQTVQNLSVVEVSHDAIGQLSTIVLERANQTGDPSDAVFSTSIAALDVIWAYDVNSSEEFPSPTLSFHGVSGRGFARITFAPVPEPRGVALGAWAAGGVLVGVRRRRGQESS